MNETPISNALTLTAAFQVLYLADVRHRLTVKMVHIANTDAADRTVQLCYVPAAPATAVQGNAALWNYTIPANDFIEFGEGQMILGGGSIQALASLAAVVNVHLSGIEELVTT